ncbi:MAG: nucleotidyltransferase domain-containing protein [Methylococcales bacterium]
MAPELTFFKAMRITLSQAQVTKTTIDRVLGIPNQVWIFGSRANDHQQGGDIDLLVETERVIPNRAEAICRLHGALTMALGERRLDLILKDARTGEAPIFEIARRTGVML